MLVFRKILRPYYRNDSKNLTNGNLGRFEFSDSFGRRKLSTFSYHESNLSLIVFIVNHQLIPFPIQPKSTSLEQSCYDRSQTIVVASLYCLLFSTSKNKYR